MVQYVDLLELGVMSARGDQVTVGLEWWILIYHPVLVVLNSVASVVALRLAGLNLLYVGSQHMDDDGGGDGKVDGDEVVVHQAGRN